MKFNLKLVKFNLKDEAPCLSILAAMWLLALWAWPRAADRIAIHFNVEWKADGFGGKLEGLLFLPAVATVIYIASMFGGERQRSPAGLVLWRSGQWFGPRLVPRIGVLGLFLAIYLMVVGRAVGWSLSLDVLSIALGVFLIVLGNYLPKVKPNVLIGVRTPWTYRSDLSWYRTHRLAGRLFVLAGVATIVTGVIRPGGAVAILLGAVVVAAAVCIPYSYVVWREDSARHDGQKPSSIVK